MPPVPRVFADVQSFLAKPGFPSVFAQLVPTTATPVAVPLRSDAAGMAAPDLGSVVKVLGRPAASSRRGRGSWSDPGWW